MIARTFAMVGLFAVAAVALGGLGEESGFEDPLVEDASACQDGKCGPCHVRGGVDPQDGTIDPVTIDCYN